MIISRDNIERQYYLTLERDHKKKREHEEVNLEVRSRPMCTSPSNEDERVVWWALVSQAGHILDVPRRDD